MSFLVHVGIFCLKKERTQTIEKILFFSVSLPFIIVLNHPLLLLFFVPLWLIKIVESIVMKGCRV
jgi:hypothetical protein